MRSKLIQTSLLGMICALAIGGAVPAAFAQLSEEDKAAIKTGVAVFERAATAGNWDGIASLNADNAVLLPPNMPVVKGRAAIRAHFTAFPLLEDLKLEVVEIGGDGDLDYIRGQYSMTILMEGTDPVQDKGKFLEIRRKQKDGTWLNIQDMHSSDLGGKP